MGAAEGHSPMDLHGPDSAAPAHRAGGVLGEVRIAVLTRVLLLPSCPEDSLGVREVRERPTPPSIRQSCPGDDEVQAPGLAQPSAESTVRSSRKMHSPGQSSAAATTA